MRASLVGNMEMGVNTETATGLKLKDVIAADNAGGGLFLRAVDGAVERTHAGANEGNGITLQTGGGNTVKKSRASANGMNGGGIVIFQGSTANAVQKNVALGNGSGARYDRVRSHRVSAGSRPPRSPSTRSSPSSPTRRARHSTVGARA